MTNMRSATASRTSRFGLRWGLPQIGNGWPLVLVLVAFVALWTNSRGTPFQIAARVVLAFESEQVPARIIGKTHHNGSGRHGGPPYDKITYWFKAKDGVARTHTQKITSQTLSKLPIPMPPMVTYSPRLPVFSAIHPDAMGDLVW